MTNSLAESLKEYTDAFPEEGRLDALHQLFYGFYSRIAVVDRTTHELARWAKDDLTDVDRLRKARVHPIAVLAALKTYAQGRGERGKNTWAPVQSIESVFANSRARRRALETGSIARSTMPATSTNVVVRKLPTRS